MSAKTIYERRLSADRHEIRLLSLLSGSDKDAIHCELCTVSLGDGPKFNALSYVWGDVSKTKPIYVGEQIFNATTNLELALRHIRKPDAVQTLWVDAVCINQADVVERNHQVPLMRKIYTEADNVLIWLGEGDEHSDALFSAISNDEIPSPPTRDNDYDRFPEEMAIEIQRLDAMLHKIATREWWIRVWIVQECILPEKPPVIWCGTKTLLWSQFFDGLWKTRRGAMRILPETANHPSVMDIYHSAGKSRAECSNRMSFLELLDFERDAFGRQDPGRQISGGFTGPRTFSTTVLPFLGRKASVAHDYIYGLLSLLPEEKSQLIPIDYERPHWEIYREFTKELLRSGDPEDHSLLSSVSFQSSPHPHRPSWVPDFSSQVGQNGDTRDTGWYLGFDNPLWGLPEPRFSDDGNILMLRGVFLDVIHKVYPFDERGDGWMDVLDRMERRAKSIIRKRQREFQQQVESNGSGSSLEPLFIAPSPSLRRLFSAMSDWGLRVMSAEVADDQLDFWWDVFQTEGHDRWVDLTGPESKRKREELAGRSTSEVVLGMLNQAKTVCRGRNLIVTKRESLLGICVPGAVAGDVLACLSGMSMPWVLRPTKDKDYYTVVGGAFVHGLTDCAVLEKRYEEGRLTEATFRIR
jgi:Heterokaryon incompatibility protein (HET)